MSVVYRPGQEEAIQRIVGAYPDKKFVFLDAPCGSGKSLILVHAAKVLWERNGMRAVYTTPQVPLVNQLETDSLLMLKVIMGRRNYPCSYLTTETADTAPCVVGLSKGNEVISPQMIYKECQEEKKLHCEYYAKLRETRTAPIWGTTLEFFLLTGRKDEKVLIVDEADGITSYLVGRNSLHMGEKFWKDDSWQDIWIQFLHPLSFSQRDITEYNADEILSVLGELYQRFQGCVSVADEMAENAGTQKDLAKAAHWRDYLVRVSDRIKFLMTIPQDVVLYWNDEGAFCASPVTLQNSFRELCEPFDFVVLSSGSFGDIRFMASELGIESYEHVKTGFSFPADRCPVVSLATKGLSHKNLESEIGNVVSELEQIMAKEPGRGFIHVPSYYLMDMVCSVMSSEPLRRLVLCDKTNRNTSFKKWVGNGIPNSVFIAPGMYEGIDLKDDLAEWQVVIKAPYPDLKDVKVRKRLSMPDGEQWYRQETLRKLLQCLGRIMRSEDDQGRTYILDKHVSDLLYASDIDWVRARMRKGEILKWKQRKQP